MCCLICYPVNDIPATSSLSHKTFPTSLELGPSQVTMLMTPTENVFFLFNLFFLGN